MMINLTEESDAPQQNLEYFFMYKALLTIIKNVHEIFDILNFR